MNDPNNWYSYSRHASSAMEDNSSISTIIIIIYRKDNVYYIIW